jgi:hypothetical protein
MYDTLSNTKRRMRWLSDGLRLKYNLFAASVVYRCFRGGLLQYRTGTAAPYIH